MKKLPLKYKTPDKWAKQALRDPLALLSDHAYLERKANSNALDLLNRWPETADPGEWVTSLSAVARDEATHLNAVLKILKKKGGTLARTHASTYAKALRKLVRNGQGKTELMDRLLVTSLIEARSCERFDLLARNCPDKPLATFYKSLWTSEFGHYNLFLSLARLVQPRETVKKRWKEMLEKEAEIIRQQPAGSGIHTGV